VRISRTPPAVYKSRTPRILRRNFKGEVENIAVHNGVNILAVQTQDEVMRAGFIEYDCFNRHADNILKPLR
jgi:hypothetical protein